MSHPYRNRPTFTYWATGVEQVSFGTMDPVVSVPFTIGRNDAVATAGSCFAQHIARSLASQGFNYMITENARDNDPIDQENFGVFTARYGNIYTIRQLLQLFLRAYSLVRPKENVWQLRNGSYVDPFRPRIRSNGWPSVDAVQRDTARHLNCVRDMFENCSVFVFTLGLTEAWIGVEDGMVYPLAPGAVFDCNDARYRFLNFRVGDMITDMLQFIDKFRAVNSAVRFILTVSPVPLIATAEDRHVLVSNTYSKGALRAVAEEVALSREKVSYFPSYEIIAGPQAKSRYYGPDLRSITDQGVSEVMSVFSRHYLSSSRTESLGAARLSSPFQLNDHQAYAAAINEFEAVTSVVCDEESLVAGDDQP